MAPYTPTDNEISSAIHNALHEHIVPSLGYIHAFIKERWPRWMFSKQAMHLCQRLDVHLTKIRFDLRENPPSPLQFNSLLILPDNPHLPRNHQRYLASLDAVRMRIIPLNIALDVDGAPTRDALRQQLGQGRAIPQRKIYHEDPDHISWYYVIYGQDTRTQTDGNPDFNSLAQRFVRNRSGFTGPGLVVKGGLTSQKGEWLNSEYMTVDDFARTLWYYHHTGARVRYVASQRSSARRSVSQRNSDPSPPRFFPAFPQASPD
ncbi:hypothetical protein FA95DRAFT_1574801 [Auriscalpium vulgare]|uniref:Uncharacterized protein n=1 Tax=Auriscalpium vulgare TaxID=40419 RepID=A0ACB8RJL5_9AGAM|nr:hypothetical protein FA95DRAFT_1574801 [Auriscalpium vulgare]